MSSCKWNANQYVIIIMIIIGVCYAIGISFWKEQTQSIVNKVIVLFINFIRNGYRKKFFPFFVFRIKIVGCLFCIFGYRCNNRYKLLYEKILWEIYADFWRNKAYAAFLFNTVETIFSHWYKRRNILHRAKKIIYRQHGAKSEAECLREQRTKAVLRRNHIKNLIEKDIPEINTFFRQYSPMAEDKGKKVFFLIDRAISQSVNGERPENRKRKRYSLNLALIISWSGKNYLKRQRLHQQQREKISAGNRKHGTSQIPVIPERTAS